MKRKSIRFVALFTLLIMTMMCTILGTLSWFVTTTTLPDHALTGESAGAYFAYGNGNPRDDDPKNKPYGISHPRHLYNLAWLTYIGYFGTSQPVFELADSIPPTGLDMEGYVLPPIGTEDYPFIGSFDGNGKIIKNLTVSNDETTLFSSDHHPDESSIDFETPQIVGMFGVVGNYTGSGTYSSAANSITNLGLTDITIEAKSSKTLAGIVAGYVDAPITDVAVASGDIDIQNSSTTAVDSTNLTGNLSDYSIVGYCTDEYKTNVQTTTENIYGIDVQHKEFNIAEQDEDEGYGGSINMTELYKRILNIKTNATASNYSTSSNVVYGSNGTSVVSSTSATNGSFHRYSSDPEMGNYSIGNGNSDRFMYMSGGHYETATRQYAHTGKPISFSGLYLNMSSNGSLSAGSTNSTLWSYSTGTSKITTTYNGTTYYLVNSSGTLSTTTSSNSATTFTITQTTNSQSQTVYSIAHGTYYMTAVNNTFIMTNTNSYTIKNTNGIYMGFGSSGSGYYRIVGVNSSSSEIIYFRYDSSNNYYYYQNGNTKYILGYYKTTSWGQSTVYSCALTTSTNYPLQPYSLSNTTYGTGIIQDSDAWTPHCDSIGSYWETDTSVNQVTVDYFPASSNYVDYYSSDSNKDGPDTASYSAETGMKYTSTDTTYMPLSVVKDGTQSNYSNYKAKEKNTGYIVSGSNSTTLPTNTGNNAYKSSLMRVSQYPVSNISSSYTSSSQTLNNIYTLNNDNKVQRIGSGYYTGYKQFDTAKGKLLDVLKMDNSNVYGLHFMNATISKNETVKPSYAVVNGTVYNTVGKEYEMPVNSIDFSLHQQGYINFFAGMYFGSNDSFFSLHHIIRDTTDNHIINIKEITGVYSDGDDSHSYVYSYSDGKFSAPYLIKSNGTRWLLSNSKKEYVEKDCVDESTAYSGYSLVFDTKRIRNYSTSGTIVNSNFAWDTYTGSGDSRTYTDKTIKDANNNNVIMNKLIYYFEIPMNIGEFALGSVTGGTGGYLFYLDIGANARQINRTVFTEHFATSTETMEYPLGVAFVASLTTDANGIFVMTDSDSACITIAVGYGSKLSISRTGDTVSIGGNTANTIGEYKANNITLTSASSPPVTVVPKTVSEEVWRMQYYDYDPVTHGTTITQIIDTETSINGGAETTHRQVKQYDEDGVLVYDSDDENLNSRENIFIYDHNEGINKGKNIVDTSTITITAGADNSIVLLTYTVNGVSVIIDGVTYDFAITDIQYDLTAAADGNYYKVTGYTITINIATGTATITETHYSGSAAAYSGIQVAVNDSTYVITVTGLNKSA